MVQPVPQGYHRITPMIIFKDARRAIDFYKRAFGAVERFVMPGPDGKGVMHAELQMGDSIFMLGEEHPQCPSRSAQTLGGSPVSFYLYVNDADAALKTAVMAGAAEEMPVQEMFWGDRMGCVKDPFGYSWSLSTHVRDLTPEQIAQGAQEWMAQQAAK